MEVIIAIDTEPEYLNNTESLLSGAKYNFVKANEFKKGMDYVKTATPDLLMIGINKIDKELIDTIQFFKKNNTTKNIPILGIYKEQKRADIENGFRLGISAYLVQPLDKHRLLDKVKELMEFLRTVEMGQCCIDVRDIPDMTLDEVKVFEKIVALFGTKRVSIIAGKHLGKIIAGSDLSEKANLFMSLEDYVVFLKTAKILP